MSFVYAPKFSYVNPDVPAGNTINSSLLLNPETTFTSQTVIPANTIIQGQTRLVIEASGIYGSGVISLPLTVNVKLGGVTISTAGLVPVLNLANRGWDFRVLVEAMSTTTVESQGFATFSTAPATAAIMDMENTTSVGIDTTVDQALTVTAQWGALAVGGTIQMRILSAMVV